MASGVLEYHEAPVTFLAAVAVQQLASLDTAAGISLVTQSLSHRQRHAPPTWQATFAKLGASSRVMVTQGGRLRGAVELVHCKQMRGRARRSLESKRPRQKAACISVVVCLIDQTNIERFRTA